MFFFACLNIFHPSKIDLTLPKYDNLPNFSFRFLVEKVVVNLVKHFTKPPPLI